MRRAATVAFAAALIPCASALSGCGAATAGANNANLSQAQLLARLQSALAGASAMPGTWEESKDDGTDSALSYALMLQELNAPSKYSYTYHGMAAIAGHEVAQYDEADIDGGGVDKVLSIPYKGSALPVSVDGGTNGSFTFVWNQPTTVVAPPSSDVVPAPTA